MNKTDFKKKVKVLWKKFLKFLRKMWLVVKALVIHLYEKFMELPRKIRYVIGVWVAVVIILLVFIGGSDNSKKFYVKYAQYEKNVSARALSYVEQNSFYATKDNKLKLNLDVLKEENYVSKSDLDDDTCEGYSIIYYDDNKDEFVINSYLHCKKYTSEKYWDNK